jgi:protein phosphatase
VAVDPSAQGRVRASRSARGPGRLSAAASVHPPASRPLRPPAAITAARKRAEHDDVPAGTHQRQHRRAGSATPQATDPSNRDPRSHPGAYRTIGAKDPFALDTGWLVLDCELLPWSAKAMDLIRRQYASVGAAARSGLNAAVTTLETAATRGPDVAGLIANEQTRAREVDQYIDAYRRYVGTVDGVPDLRLAPFHILAAENAVFVEREHAWHLDLCDRLVAADSEWLVATRRVAVDLADEQSAANAISWWEQLTAGGGEGMVVKPAGFTASGRTGLVQPGIKCRGREYLRIIYGPEYTDPSHIRRLRGRNLGRKRSLAIREFGLGIEALERFVALEPLYRVHECVFGVLAMESEPIDPRL